MMIFKSKPFPHFISEKWKGNKKKLKIRSHYTFLWEKEIFVFCFDLFGRRGIYLKEDIFVETCQTMAEVSSVLCLFKRVSWFFSVNKHANRLEIESIWKVFFFFLLMFLYTRFLCFLLLRNKIVIFCKRWNVWDRKIVGNKRFEFRQATLLFL